MTKKTKYSKKAAEFICEKIADGETLTAICAKYSPTCDYIPRNSQSVHRWLTAHEDFKKEYLTARIIQMYQWMDEMKDISDSEIPPIDDKMLLNAEIQRRRLKVDTLKFMAAKLAPKLVPELADRQQVTHTVEPIQVISYASQPLKGQEKLVTDLSYSEIEHHKD